MTTNPSSNARRWRRMTLSLFLLLALCRQTLGESRTNLVRRMEDGEDEEEMNNFNTYIGDDDTLTTCENEIIQVTAIQTVCDSPYTYYWGSGAHRNSDICYYGDKASITVYFDVMEKIDANIYMIMSVYAGYGKEVVTATSPKNIQKYVGSDCQEPGSYSFTTTTSALGSSGSSKSGFSPWVQVAFSSQKDGGYNLGAANIPCQWDEDQEMRDWTEITQLVHSQMSTRDFFVEYGILIGTVAVCGIFVAIFSKIVVDRYNSVSDENGTRRQRHSPRHQRQADPDKSSAFMMQQEASIA